MSHKFRRSALVSAAVTALLTLVACGITPASEQRGPGSLVVDIVNYPATFDPGRQYDTDSYTVYRNIFDQLLHRDPDTHEVVPWLATSWKRQSPTRWTFHIRRGVRFSNGEPLTAEDVGYSIDRILDKDFGSEQYANFSAIKSTQADGHKLTIVTDKPSPTLLSYMTTLSVVPKDYVEQVGNATFNEQPVGSGPYQMKTATTGSSVVLTRNPRWWGETPDVRTVEFRAVPNIASRVADLQAGKADLVTSLTPDAAGQVTQNPRLKVLSTPTERVAYIAFNTIHGGAVEDPRVRRAIALSINYDALIKNLRQDMAKPVNSVLTPLATGYPKKLPDNEFDPERARELLADADATHATVVMATSPSFDPQIVQAIQANLAAVGLTVEIQNSDHPTYLEKVQSPAHDWGGMRFGRWSCSCLDADGVIYPLFHSDTVWSSYSNPAFDRLIERARTQLDPATRQKTYEKAFKVLDEDVPGIGLFQDYAIYGATDDIDWEPDAQENFFVARVSTEGS